jgi:hypothetical protein
VEQQRQRRPRKNARTFTKSTFSLYRLSSSSTYCFSGGSSGSLMAFFAEAIFANPHVTSCGDEKCCSMDEQNGRISFLLRSFEELANSFQSTLQDNALGSAAGFLAQVEAAGIITDLNGATEEQQSRGVENLIKLFVRLYANHSSIVVLPSHACPNMIQNHCASHNRKRRGPTTLPCCGPFPIRKSLNTCQWRPTPQAWQ